MAIIRHIGEDPKTALVLASKMLAGERHTPEEGGGATLQIGDYVIELSRQELALVAALSIQRPTHIEITTKPDEPPQSRVLGVFVLGSTPPDEPIKG